MRNISRWLIGLAITVGVTTATPDIAEAQAWGFDCATCDGFAGVCSGNVSVINDRCVMGWDHDDHEFFCASWGRLWCDPRLSFNAVGADGTILRTDTFATSAPTAPRAQESASRHVRDCRSRIVARSYGTDEAEDMRRRTESIAI